MVVDTLQLRDNLLKILFVLFVTSFFYSCGGGGGSGSSSSSSASTYNWATSVNGTATGRYLLQGSDAYTYTNTGTVTYAIDAAADTITLSSGGYHDPDLDSNTFSSYSSSATGTDTQSNAGTANLTTINYNYSYTDPVYNDSVALVIAVPTNYNHQVYLFWSTNDRSLGTGFRWLNYAMLPITKTAYTDLPSSGTASYSGAIDGTWNNKTAANFYTIGGDASFSVDWGAKSISGSLANLTIVDDVTDAVTSFPSLTVSSATIQNSSDDATFSSSLSGSSLTGSISGLFLGSSYEEIGGGFTVRSSDSAGDNRGVGVFSAKR